MTRRADGLRVVEALELLLDAGQWEAADDIYRIRSDNGDVWDNLPAARLGLRAAGVFVASPLLRDACATHLNGDRLSYYVHEVSVFAFMAGDLSSAQEYLSIAVTLDRDTDNAGSLAIGLQSLADCLIALGHPGPARDVAAEAVACGRPPLVGRTSVRGTRTWDGWRIWTGTPRRPSGTSSPPTRSSMPTTWVMTICPRGPGHAGRSGCSAPGGPSRPGSWPSGTPRSARSTAGTVCWPCITVFWAAWPWPQGTP